MTKYITEDGYIFVLMPNGTLTDGDMVFDSLDDLLAAMEYTPENPTVFHHFVEGE